MKDKPEKPKAKAKPLKQPRFTIVLRADIQDHEKQRGYGGAATVHTNDRSVGLAKGCGDLEREFNKLPPEPPLIVAPTEADKSEVNKRKQN